MYPTIRTLVLDAEQQMDHNAALEFFTRAITDNCHALFVENPADGYSHVFWNLHETSMSQDTPLDVRKDMAYLTNELILESPMKFLYGIKQGYEIHIVFGGQGFLHYVMTPNSWIEWVCKSYIKRG